MKNNHEYESRPHLPGAGTMQDYTVPFLVTAGVLTFVLLIVVWASVGYAFALIAGFLANRAMPGG